MKNKPKWYLVLVLGLALLLAVSVVACGETKTTEKSESPPAPEVADEWEALNDWLDTMYNLPRVYNTEQLKHAAIEVDMFWFEQADYAVKKLERHNIPWERTAPFCLDYYCYILASSELLECSEPLKFIASDMGTVETVKTLHDTADHLIEMKLSGEALSIYPTEDACLERFGIKRNPHQEFSN